MYNMNYWKHLELYHFIFKGIAKKLNEAFVAKKGICYIKKF